MDRLTDEEGVALKALAAHIRGSTWEYIAQSKGTDLVVSPTSALVLTTLYIGGILRFDHPESERPTRDTLMLQCHLNPLRQSLEAAIGTLGLSPLEDPSATGLGPHLENVPRLLPAPRRATGLLLAIAIGAACTDRTALKQSRIFLNLGKIELEKVEVSREAPLAAELKLDNLVCIIEHPGSQPDNPGPTAASLAETWRRYGWRVIEIPDGTDAAQVYHGLCVSRQAELPPRPTLVIVCRRDEEGSSEAVERYAAPTLPEAARVAKAREGIAQAKAEVARLCHDDKTVRAFMKARLQKAAMNPPGDPTVVSKPGSKRTDPEKSKQGETPPVGHTLKRRPRESDSTIAPASVPGHGSGRNSIPSRDGGEKSTQSVNAPDALKGRSIAVRAHRVIELAQGVPQDGLTSFNLARIFKEFDAILRIDPTAFDSVKPTELAAIRSRLTQSLKAQANTCSYADARRIIYGLDALRWNTKSDVDSLLGALAQRLNTFSPQEVKEIRQAVWKLNYPHAGFSRALATYFGAKIDDISDIVLIDTIGFLYWRGAPAEARTLIGVAAPHFGRMSDEHIARLATIAAATNVKSPQVKQAIAATFIERLKSRNVALGVHDASTILHALAELGHHDPAALDIFHRNFVNRFNELKIADLRDIAWSYATLGEKNRPLFLALVKAAIAAEPGEQDAFAWQLGSIAWAGARLNIVSTSLIKFVADHFAGTWSTLPTGALANLAWGFCLNNSKDARGIIAAILDATTGKELAPEHRHQLRLAAIAAGLARYPRCPAEIHSGTSEFARPPKMNTFESAVFKVLQTVAPGTLHVEPFHVVEGIATDFLVSLGHRKIILECDGVKYHHSANNARFGNDLIQDRVFKHHGYEVVHILDTEWFPCKPGDRAQLLKKKLNLTS